MKKYFNLNIENILMSIFSQLVLFHVTANFLWFRIIVISISRVVVIIDIISTDIARLTLVYLSSLAIDICISNNPLFLLLLPLRLLTEHHRDGQLYDHVVKPGRGLKSKTNY